MRTPFIGLLAGCTLMLPTFASAATPDVLLLGQWQSETIDKETRVRELTRVEFGKDGSYEAYLQLSPFQFRKVTTAGRYAVKVINKTQFVLSVERKSGDVDVDPDEAKDSDTITIVDDKTLRASDGSILRRIQ